MKIGLYVENKNIPDADLRFPENGNPGIGGTHFNFACLAYYLDKFYSDKIEIYFYTNFIDLLPVNIKKRNASSLIEAVEKAAKDSCDIFIFRVLENELSKEFLKKIDSLNIKLIARAHNDLSVKTLDILNKSDSIKKIVGVGKKQIERIKYHSAYRKSTYIFHFLNASTYKSQHKQLKENKTVVFLGNIIPAKGFLYLARIWKKILKACPEAKLQVIGSGRLYNRNKKMGKWGVAEESYEKKIRKYLSDEKGKILASVNFCGLLGQEKIKILQNATLGVVNPTGSTETFCMSAVEIQASGTPVVTGAFKSLLDTVKHNETGLLGKTEKDLYKNIVYLLKNEKKAQELGQNAIKFIEEEFVPQKSCAEWMALLEEIMDEAPGQTKAPVFFHGIVVHLLFMVREKIINFIKKISYPL